MMYVSKLLMCRYICNDIYKWKEMKWNDIYMHDNAMYIEWHVYMDGHR